MSILMNNTVSGSEHASESADDHGRPLDPEMEEPEGGLQAWLTVLGSFLIFFPSFGFVNSFGYFQTFYQQHYLTTYPPSTIAFIGTLQITLLYLLGPITGSLFDAYGLRYLYIIAGIGCSGSLLALSFTHPEQIWQQFLAQGVLFGLAIPFGVQPASAVVGQYFHRRRALAMGIVAGGSSIGGVCFPIMFSKLVPAIGFSWSLRVAVLLFIVCHAIAICISRAKHPSRQLKNISELVDFAGYKDPRYATIAIGGLIANFGLYTPYYYIEPFADAAGFSSSMKPYLLPLINGLSFFGRVLGGHAADKLGRLNALYSMTFIAGIICFALWLPASNISFLIGFTCLYGFGTGVLISVGPAAISQISPVTKLGARQGAYSCVLAIATLTGTPIGGAISQGGTRHDYNDLAIYTGATITIGGVVLFIARIMCDRNLMAKF